MLTILTRRGIEALPSHEYKNHPSPRKENAMKLSHIFSVVLPTFTIGLIVSNSTPAAPEARTILHGSAPSWANSRNFVSVTDPGNDVGFRVYLGWWIGIWHRS